MTEEHGHGCNHGEHGGCHEEHDHAAHGCSDSGCGSGCCDGCGDRVIYITEDEHAFLLMLAQTPFLPLGRFIMTSSKSDDLESVALAPVYMTDRHETMETVKKTGRTLTSMEEKGLITLDYDLPLEQADYSVFEESALYKAFCETVREGSSNNTFLFDQPLLETGSIALTALGRAALESLAELDRETDSES